MIINDNEALLRATRAAIARAKRRGSAEVTPDDLLVGLLQAVARFGVALIGPWAIDLEALGEPWCEEPGQRSGSRPAYAPETAALFDRAAAIARQDGVRHVELVHLLVAYAPEERGLMAALKQQYGFTAAQWRAALAQWVGPEAERPAPGLPASGKPPERVWLSPDEAAAFLGVHTQTIRGYIRAGKLPAYRLAGERVIRLRYDDLLALLEPLTPEETGMSGEA